MDYTNSFTINNKTYKFRKWKVKDRLALNTAKTQSDIRTILVYNCLEDKTAIFDDFQYQYALIQIRNASLKNKLYYPLECENCGAEFDYEADLNEIIKPQNSQYKLITSNNINIEVQDIKNREFYENKVLNAKTPEETKIIDFVLHIKSINDNESLDFNQTCDFILNLDVDDYESIFNQWESMHFKILRTKTIKCPKCGLETEISFDNLPKGFFPESWNI